MDQKSVYEALRQIWDGDDIASPSRAFARLTAEQACTKLPGSPYSVATNALHMLFWQRLWLNRLKGLKAESFMQDWRVPKLDEWTPIKAEFVAGMEEAMAICSKKPFKHKMKSDEIALKTLQNIATHNAYHLGQIYLLKRQLKASTTT